MIEHARKLAALASVKRTGYFLAMQPPRWFYATLAACAVVLTLTASYVMLSRRNVGRWLPMPSATDVGPRALDTTTGILCAMTATSSGCIDLPHGTRNIVSREAEHP